MLFALGASGLWSIGVISISWAILHPAWSLGSLLTPPGVALVIQRLSAYRYGAVSAEIAKLGATRVDLLDVGLRLAFRSSGAPVSSAPCPLPAVRRMPAERLEQPAHGELRAHPAPL